MIHFLHDRDERVGFSIDLTVHYQEFTPIGTFLVSRAVMIDCAAKRHIMNDHPNDIEWFEKNHAQIEKVIRQPEIIDSSPRPSPIGTGILVAQAIHIEHFTYLLAVIKHPLDTNKKLNAKLYTLFRCPRRYFYQREMLKPKWKLLKE